MGFILYKCINLGVLSVFYPWTDRWHIGTGVLGVEGVLVSGKTGAFCSVYILTYTLIRRLDSVRTILRLYIFGVIIVVGYGLFQFFILRHPAITSTFRNIHVLGQIIPGIWGLEDPWFGPTAAGHEHLGAYMILAISIVGGTILCKWPTVWRWRLLLMALWLGCIFILIFCSSRGAWIGGLCALGMFVIVSIKEKEGSRIFLIILGVSCIFLILDLGSGIDVVEYIKGRSAKLFMISEGQIADDSARERIGVFLFLWHIFLDHPLIGWGPGGAGRIAEGQLIRELVEGGLIGGVLFLTLMFTGGRIALKAYRISDNPMTRGVCIGFVCGLVGLFSQSFFTEIFVLTKVSVPFWALMASIHKLCRLERLRYIPV